MRYRSSLILASILIALNAASQKVSTASPALDAVDSLATVARAERADLLSPGHFGAAERDRSGAHRELSGGTERGVAKRLERADTAYRLALTTAARGREILSGALAGRDSAVASGAPQVASGIFEQAEGLFRQAALAVEAGNERGASIKGADAERRFRDAELLALKEKIGGEARRLLLKADQEMAFQWAPTTFARARDLLARAIRGLDEDRTRRNEPLLLASEAEVEAKRGFGIAARARTACQDPAVLEGVIADGEAQLKNVGEPLGVSVDFTDGLAASTARIVDAIASMRAERDSLTHEIATLAAEAETGRARERSLAAELTASQERAERLKRVRNLFAPGEASIHRQGGTLILRVPGITFLPAKSELLPESETILGKVVQAIRDLPGAALTIEGHTDSQGDAAKNLELSEGRAQAVRAYIESRMDLSDRIVRVKGVGEERPVASNDSEEGRAQNRRIDLVFDAPHLIGE